MKFVSDFHIHSKYSRATSKECDLENYYISGKKKGVNVIGSGDWTFPKWQKEIFEKLEPAEEGLFKLCASLEKEINEKFNFSSKLPVRFILTTEISSIYKKDGKVRKIHNIIFVPFFEDVKKVSLALSKIGNISSDGRPILSLPSKDLLEMLLSISPSSFLIPAHIWTPWFSLFGANSGFDSVEECFGNYSSEIFALETGLSSDPPMNWRVSALDKYTLVSNSDAHSPSKLAREANLFDCEMNFYSIKEAIKSKNNKKFLGTIEFFPEEGKYHLDGHRICGLKLQPEETKKLNGICPKCKKPITIGVLHRVEELADMKKKRVRENAPLFYSLIPLQEIISEIISSPLQSRKTIEIYDTLVKKNGSELDILLNLPLSQIKCQEIPLLVEAISRMREGRVKKEEGFDGKYGVIKLFEEGEIEKLKQKILFGFEKIIEVGKKKDFELFEEEPQEVIENAREEIFLTFTTEQREAIESIGSPVLLYAGPGTGKTRVLTEKVVHLIKKHAIKPENILVLTFTNYAAREVKERLGKIFQPEIINKITIGTFHSICAEIIRCEGHSSGINPQFLVADEELQEKIIKRICKEKQIIEKIIRFKQNLIPSENVENQDLREIYEKYNQELLSQSLLDFEDLIFIAIEILKKDPIILEKQRKIFKYILVDEYQDINFAQFSFLKILAGDGKFLFAVGDPDQSIYGFRGSDYRFFLRFSEDFPQSRIFKLSQSFRTTSKIISASQQVISKNISFSGISVFSKKEGEGIKVLVSKNEEEEGEKIAKVIKKLVGGFDFHSIDTGEVDGYERELRSFSEIAVLARTHSVLQTIADVFQKEGIPYQVIKRSRSTEELIEIVQKMEGKEITEIIEELKKQGLLIEDFNEFINEQHLLSYLSLLKEVDYFNEKAEKVSLLTIHSSKGLEFDTVFISGCEDGIIPHLKFFDDSSGIEEERRLFYVGITRAKRLLFLSYCFMRNIGGKAQKMLPSRFLKEIKEELLFREEEREKLKRKIIKQLDLF